MNEFENKQIKGIHASRYVASWLNEGGSLLGVWDDTIGDIVYPFEEWLKTIPFKKADGTIDHISDDDATFIRRFATNGKMELQLFAEDYIANNKQK